MNVWSVCTKRFEIQHSTHLNPVKFDKTWHNPTCGLTQPMDNSGIVYGIK